MTDVPVELLDDFELPSARGGRRAIAQIDVSVVRSLTSADIPALTGATGVETSQVQSVKKLTHSHHLLAQSLAKGLSQAEAALVTGYSPSYICNIAGHDPAFRELVESYRSEREALYVDALERMKAVGLSSLDEIQSRLAEDPAAFSNRELTELAETMLVKGARQGTVAGSGGVGSPGGLAISIKFVAGAEPRPMVDVTESATPRQSCGPPASAQLRSDDR